MENLEWRAGSSKRDDILPVPSKEKNGILPTQTKQHNVVFVTSGLVEAHVLCFCHSLYFNGDRGIRTVIIQ